MPAKLLVSGTYSVGTCYFLQVTAMSVDEGTLPQCFSWQVWADQQGQLWLRAVNSMLAPLHIMQQNIPGSLRATV